MLFRSLRAASAEISGTRRDGCRSRIQRGWLGIERHIRAQPQLPGAVLDQVPHAAKRVRPDPVGRMHRRLRKQFVLVDQFQPRERIVSLAKIQRRFQQIAVQIRIGRDFVHASPEQRRRPVARPPAAGCIPPMPSAATGCPVPALRDAPAAQCCIAPSSCARAQRWPVPTTNRAAPSWMLQRSSFGSRPLKAEASSLTRSITNPVVTTPKLVCVESCK